MEAVRPLAAMFALAAVCGAASASDELARSKNCVACHAADRKVLGPSYREIAAKYARDAVAVEKLSAKVQKGGAGVWGPIPMPPQPGVSPADAETLVRWILTHK